MGIVIQHELFRHRLHGFICCAIGKNMELNRLIYLLICLFTLGCDNNASFAQICENYQQACQEFQQDTWCKKERVQLVFAHVAFANRQGDKEKFNTLMAYEDYEKCVTNVAGIDHIKFKEKKTKRIENMLKARHKIELLSNETVDSNYPSLLYYHWTHHLNKQSLATFLALEGDPIMDNPTSQYELATYYAKRDINKTISLLYRALELYQVGETINVEIFKSLTSIYAKMGDSKQAYIWLKVLTLAAPKDKQINHTNLQRYQDNSNLDQRFLDKVARALLENIKKAKFVAPT